MEKKTKQTKVEGTTTNQPTNKQRNKQPIPTTASSTVSFTPSRNAM
jgi:hypothetical protein